jgi:hypothetical protein
MKAHISKYYMVPMLLIVAALAYAQPRKPGSGGKPKTSKPQKESFVDKVFGDVRKKAKRAEMKSKNRELSQFTVKTDFSKTKRHIMFGANLGAANYFGDLAPRYRRGSTDLALTRTAMGAFAGYRVHPFISLYGSLSWFRIKGDDHSSDPSIGEDGYGRYVRGLHFRNDIKELAFYGTFDLHPGDKGYKRRMDLNPYAFIGISVFHHNPVARLPVEVPGQTRPWVKLQPLGTSGQYSGLRGAPRPYSLWQIAIPLGVGARYRVKDNIDIGLNIGYRLLFTDYIDDVSEQYPVEEAYDAMYKRNPLSVVMSNRSAEQYAASTGEKRTMQGVNDVEVFYQNGNGFEARRIPGNMFGGAPRGNKRRDYLITTCLTATYYYDIKQRPPRFR